MRVREFSDLAAGLRSMDADDFLDRQTVAELKRLGHSQQARGGTTRYRVVHGNDRLLGFVPVYHLPAPFHSSVDPTVVFAAEYGTQPATHGTLVGSPGRFRNFTVLADGLDGPARRAAVRLLLFGEEGPPVSGRGSSFMLLPQLSEAQWQDYRGVVGADAPAHVDHDAVLDVSWTDFESYVRTLPSKYRAGVRRERQEFLASDAVLEECDIKDVYQEIAPLLCEVEAKHGERLRREQAMWFLYSIAQSMGPAGRVLVLRERDEAVAFCVFWRYGTELVNRVWGCRTAPSGTGHHLTYVNLSVYELVTRAARYGSRTLRLGTGSPRPKKSRGATLVPLRTVLLADPPHTRTPATQEAGSRR